MSYPVPMVNRRELCQTEGVTLDGKRAHICGAKLDFAMVRNSQYGIEFAWATVAHIVTNRKGAFKS